MTVEVVHRATTSDSLPCPTHLDRVGDGLGRRGACCIAPEISALAHLIVALGETPALGGAAG